eukprot:jgi/Botrbrau1/22340/Bobra.0002s0018.1
MPVRLYSLKCWGAWTILCVWISMSRHASSQPRIAIIGAGVGGSFNAYFIRQLLGPTAVLDVFEKGEVGGRTQIFSSEGKVIELGASIVHEENKYFRDAADELRIPRMVPASDIPSIYNGEDFVFRFSSWTLVNIVKMVFRYGWSYVTFMGAPSEVLKRYKTIYALQNDGVSFTTPEEMLKAMGLYELTQKSFRLIVQALLGSNWSAERFSQEFLGAVNRVQYNQNNSLSGLAGMVGTLPVTDGRLFKLQGGNVRLPVELLDKAAVRGHWPLRVSSVTRLSNGSFSLHTDPNGLPSTPEVWGPFDAVVIATPLEEAGLEFIGVDLPYIPPRKYRHTVTTVVHGRLSSAYFGVSSLSSSEYIMVTEDAPTPFSVIAPISEGGPRQLRLYKLFSELPLDDGTLHRLFRNATVLVRHDWKAYPVFSPPEQFAPFQLAEGLYYNNAWENSASAMEMSAVAAKNVALPAPKVLTWDAPVS